jgi:hypothetical protein
MQRQHIDEGGWFDSDAAEKYTCCSWTDCYSEEELYITRKGVCVLWHHSRGGETWRKIDAIEAAEWLIKTGHDTSQDKKIRAAVDAAEV